MTGFVYAIECNSRIKLGYSENPEKRVNKVASDAPFPCVLLGYWPGSVADELDVQTKFQAIRLHGEWFAATEELLAFIQQNAVPASPAGKKHKVVLDTDSPLAAWRKRAGLRQQDLAKMIGVNTAFVSQLENGVSGASLEVAVRITELCGPTVPVQSCQEGCLMNQLHMSSAEARQFQGLHGLSHGQDNRWHRNDDAVHDDEFYLAAVEGFLPREAGVAQKPIAQVFRLGNATHENIGNDSRFDQNNAHLVETPATNPPSKQAPELPATARRLSSTRRVNHGFQIVARQS